MIFVGPDTAKAGQLACGAAPGARNLAVAALIAMAPGTTAVANLPTTNLPVPWAALRPDDIAPHWDPAKGNLAEG